MEDGLEQRGMTMANSAALDVPAGKGAMWCFANASYEQTVSVVMGAQSWIFGGSGEGVLMTVGPLTAVPLDVTTDSKVTATFTYSSPTDHGQPSTVDVPYTYQNDSIYIARIGAEDGTDNDYNDSWLEIVIFKTPPPSGDAG